MRLADAQLSIEPGDAYSPVRSLAASMIELAIRDIQFANRYVNNATAMYARRTARVWIESNGHDVLSFRWCCDGLDLCPHTLRKRIFHAD